MSAKCHLEQSLTVKRTAAFISSIYDILFQKNKKSCSAVERLTVTS